MTTNAQVLLVAAAEHGRGSRRRFGNITSSVSERVIDEVDVAADGGATGPTPPAQP